MPNFSKENIINEGKSMKNTMKISALALSLLLIPTPSYTAPKKNTMIKYIAAAGAAVTTAWFIYKWYTTTEQTQSPQPPVILEEVNTTQQEPQNNTNTTPATAEERPQQNVINEHLTTANKSQLETLTRAKIKRRYKPKTHLTSPDTLPTTPSAFDVPATYTENSIPEQQPEKTKTPANPSPKNTLVSELKDRFTQSAQQTSVTKKTVITKPLSTSTKTPAKPTTKNPRTTKDINITLQQNVLTSWDNLNDLKAVLAQAATESDLNALEAIAQEKKINLNTSPTLPKTIALVNKINQLKTKLNLQ